MRSAAVRLGALRRRVRIAPVKSAADTLAEETDAAVLAMSVTERVALALRLGDRDVRLYAAANGLSEDQARRILRRNSQIGRRPSACARFDDE
jgi:endonuclease V-like protein UPF0215 family